MTNDGRFDDSASPPTHAFGGYCVRGIGVQRARDRAHINGDRAARVKLQVTGLFLRPGDI
jgi:hypothetical protein